MKLCVQVGLGPGHIVLDGDPDTPPLKGHSPPFSAHICCGQMARWIKMPLSMEVGLAPGDFVLDGDPLPQKGQSPLQFSAYVYCGQTAGWIKTPLDTEIDLGPGHIVLNGGPCSRKRGTAAPPPTFRPMSIVATVAHLSYWWALVYSNNEIHNLWPPCIAGCGHIYFHPVVSRKIAIWAPSHR